MERETLRPRGKPSSRWSLPASSKRSTCSGWLDRYCLDLVTNLIMASRSTMRSNSVMRLGSLWIGLVRGLSLGLCFFFNFLGVLVTKKEVENGDMNSRLGFFTFGIRVLENLELEGNKKKERQAIASI